LAISDHSNANNSAHQQPRASDPQESQHNPQQRNAPSTESRPQRDVRESRRVSPRSPRPLCCQPAFVITSKRGSTLRDKARAPRAFHFGRHRANQPQMNFRASPPACGPRTIFTTLFPAPDNPARKLRTATRMEALRCAGAISVIGGAIGVSAIS